jgi:hypothetical protein
MTLITIVSKDIATIVPILFEFKHKIAQHIIIYDTEKVEKSNALRLKQGIDNISNKYYITSTKTKLIALDEDSKNSFDKVFRKILKYSNLYLNTSEADTSLVVLLSKFILEQNGQVIAYDKFDNSYNLIGAKSFENHKIEFCMNIEDMFLLYNYKLKSATRATQMIEDRNNVLKLFSNFKAFIILRNALLQNKPVQETMRELLYYFNVMDKNNKILNINKITGMLFEEYIFWQLFPYDFDDIACQVSIDLLNEQNKIILNEFDIVMIKDNHLFTVECKMGHNIKGTDIIYKSDSLLSHFGDDSKNMIVNISQKEMVHNEEFDVNISSSFTLRDVIRARHHNIAIYHKNMFKSKSFFKKIENFFLVKKRIFLLGGMDLEMITIKKIFDVYNIPYINKNLKWGAKLSAYSNDIIEKYNYIGIELIEDCHILPNYTVIDHHGDLSHLPSSIEQISTLLHIPLNRYQQLVAANDRGYIPEMKKIGATIKEIKNIRKKDRVAQGVTKRDEELAKISIEKNTNEKNGILIVEALTDKFSAIIDRLTHSKIIIYNNKHINYYGLDAYKIQKLYSTLLSKEYTYFGGGKDGYFGIILNETLLLQREQFIKNILNAL